MRLATLGDVPWIMRALLAMLKYSPAPQMRYAHVETAEASLKTAVSQGRGWIMGGYFIMVDVGSDWYTNRRYLIEQIILKVDPDDKSVALETVIRNGLSYLSDHFSCVAIIVGDTQVGYMTPKYIAAGYLPLGTQLIKERPHGIRPQGDRCSGAD